MTLLEGVFIVVGFFCICISFFVAGKSRFEDEGKEGDSGVSASVWTEKEEKIIQERVEQILEERQIELVDETEDKMSRLCNEKIMAMDEFSQQVLGKIDSNHQEVVFMYNMLNEKQKEIKDMFSKPAKAQAVPEISAEETSVEETPVAKKTAGIRAVEAKQAKAKKTERAAAKPAERTTGKAAVSQARKAASEKPVKEPAAKKEVRRPKQAEEDKDVKVPGNVNLQIQKMYKEGKSILEISKTLGIGQGEVKLVIALYGGRVR